MAVVRKDRKAEAVAKPKNAKNTQAHTELCNRAVRWLRNTKGCSFAVAELVTIAGEQPDAFGFGGSGSIIVECKTSRADFRKDQKKWFRRTPERGMGNLRYYLVPPDLIKPEEVPEPWGLLYCFNKQIKVVKKPSSTESNLTAERDFLCSIVRRCSSQVDLATI